MSYDEYSAERIRRVFADLLPHHRDVAEMRMMGGLVFLLNGNMCCGISNRGLMARVGVARCEDALRLPDASVMKMGDRVMAGYILVTPDGIDSDADLERFLRLAVGFVSTLPAKALKEKKPKGAMTATRNKRG